MLPPLPPYQLWTRHWRGAQQIISGPTAGRVWTSGSTDCLSWAPPNPSSGPSRSRTARRTPRPRRDRNRLCGVRKSRLNQQGINIDRFFTNLSPTHPLPSLNYSNLSKSWPIFTDEPTSRQPNPHRTRRQPKPLRTRSWGDRRGVASPVQLRGPPHL